MIQALTSAELKTIIHNPNITIIDVREEDEFSSGAIEGAINIPLSQIMKEQAELPQDKKQQYILYCRVGRRSMMACELLRGEGYSNLYNFEGGILEFQK